MKVEECQRWFAETSLCIRELEARRARGASPTRGIYLILDYVRKGDQGYIAARRHDTDPMTVMVHAYKDLRGRVSMWLMSARLQL
jgi:hypothetical protein